MDVTVDGNIRSADFGGIQALRTREAGYSVARKCLEEQAAAERLDPSLRSEHGVRLHDNACSWYLGTLGEIEVGAKLDTLGPEWLVLHSVPIGADTTDVDHLLLGPAGVFVINTKHHADKPVWVGSWTEMVGGTKTFYGKSSAREARNVGRRLHHATGEPVTVNPVVTFVGARAIKDSREASERSVSFVPADDLVRWLRSLPIVLSPAHVGLLRLAAEQPATWHHDPRAADTMRVMPRFDRLREDVDRHLAWAASAPDGRGRMAGTARRQRTTGTRPRTSPASAASRRPAVTTTAEQKRSRRTGITIALVAVALVVLIPVVAMGSAFAASDSTGFWVGIFVVLGAIGLVVGGPTRRRRKRRR